MFKKISLLIISSCSLSLQAVIIVNHTQDNGKVSFEFSVRPRHMRKNWVEAGEKLNLAIEPNTTGLYFSDGEATKKSAVIPVAGLNEADTIIFYPYEKSTGLYPHEVLKLQKEHKEERSETNALKERVRQLETELATCKQQLLEQLPSVPGGPK